MSNGRKDYVRNKFASEELADRIRDWYHKRGFTSVKVWVENDQPISDYGTKLPPVFSIKSNIVFNVDNLSNGMIE